MRKLLIGLLLMACTVAFADLVVDIPFDLNIVGDSFSENGPYVYESEWIIITNTGTETQTYTFLYSFEDLPALWTISICNLSNCFMPDFPAPIELSPGEFEQIHIIINVNSTGGFSFNMTFSGGELSEPLNYDFTFNTADNAGIENENQIPGSPAALSQNFPNPFNPSTSIAFDLQENGHVSIEIYNLKGEKVKTLINRFIQAGDHSIIWTGDDDNGNNVSSGIYFYKMKTGRYTSTKKMSLMK